MTPTGVLIFLLVIAVLFSLVFAEDFGRPKQDRLQTHVRNWVLDVPNKLLAIFWLVYRATRRLLRKYTFWVLAVLMGLLAIPFLKTGLFLLAVGIAFIICSFWLVFYEDE